MFDELRGIIHRDYDVFSGIALEGYFQAKFMEEHAFSRIGGWWDRKGESEIDLVGDNEFTNELSFFEVKRDARRINLQYLEQKSQAFFLKHPELQTRRLSFNGLSLKNM